MVIGKKKNQKDYIYWLGKKLGYTTMEDWYKVSRADFDNNYGRSLFHQIYLLLV